MTSGSLKQAAESARARTSEVVGRARNDSAGLASDVLHTPAVRAALPFINGGISGMVATSVIQPVDMIKVRIQLAGEGTAAGPKATPLSVTRQIIASGKVLDLYTGLSAGLLRQAVYTTARLGFFDTFMGSLAARAKEQGRQVGFSERATAGLTAGGLAAMFGNPADLALIRMQSDGLKPLAERKNYKSVIDALTSIAKSEGIGALWAGAAPTVVRAMALNFGQLAFFSEAKVQLKQNTDLSARAQTLSASAIAGFFASFFSLPFDFVKTRLQKQSKGPDGKLPYKGMADCFVKVTKQEGIMRFYRGFGTYYVRIAPHAMVTLIVADYLGWLTKKRNAAQMTRRRNENSSNENGPDVYSQLLTEAGVTQARSGDASERPLKRRRPASSRGEKQAAPSESAASQSADANFEAWLNASEEHGSDVDDALELQDVAIPAPTLQTMERDSEDEYEDEDEEMHFEDVDFGVLDNAASDQNAPKNLELNLTAQRSASMPQKGNIDRRKPITKDERERRIEIHKVHLLSLLSHVARRNHWCNDVKVQNYVRPLLTDKVVKSLNPGSNLPQLGRNESLKVGLQQAGVMWRIKYKVTERGLRRSLWADNLEYLQHYELPSDMESCLDRGDFQQAAKRLQGSRDIGAQLYCALMRSAGVRARLVCSLQPLSFNAAGPGLPKPKERTTPIKPSATSEKTKRDGNTDGKAAAPAGSSARRRLGHPNAAAYNFEPPQSPARPRPTFEAPTDLQESTYPIYWVEVFNHAYQEWQPADPVVTHTFWKPKALEPPITDKQNCMCYVVAFEADGTAKDVTRRYAKAYTAKTRKLRVESASTDGEKWWRKVMKLYKSRFAEDDDQIEDIELAGREAREPMPRNVQDFKDHPTYALERHLRRHEVLVPEATPAGTVAAGNRGPLEKVYRRRDVRIARTVDKWYRLGRLVKPNEIPAKWLPKKAPNKKGRFGDDDDDDAQGDAGTPIYTLDQTELYQPPPVRDGRVPKNKFGNVDVYVPSMVPSGGVHIVHEYAARAAVNLGIDYAPALTGFEFRGKHGTAVLKGIVVAREYEDGIWAVIDALGNEEQELENERRKAAALKVWRKFLMGLRIRERIWSGVDAEERKEAEREAELDAAMEDAPSDVTEEFDMVDEDDDGGGGFMVD
ncbi:nitrilase [Paramyrothecium foliicola]|nr:nitrilase [Paramyrothecium foliicola]